MAIRELPEYTITYKSGKVQRVLADKLRIVWDNTEQTITEMSWDEMIPSPMFINLDRIESVWRSR